MILVVELEKRQIEQYHGHQFMHEEVYEFLIEIKKLLNLLGCFLSWHWANTSNELFMRKANE